IPTARAPTPMRRNPPDEVPMRWLPSACACAVVASSGNISASVAASAAAGRQAVRRSEIDIEDQPPFGAAAVVRRIVDGPGLHVVVEAVHVGRIELALAPHVALAGHLVDAIDHAGAEDVRRLQARHPPPPDQPERTVEL